MIYVFHSLTQKSFLKREAKKITKASLGEVNEFNYAQFDAKETALRDIVNACLEVPMLENKKVVVVDDAFFLAGAKGKDKINTEKDFNLLLKYIAVPSKETDLIFLVYADKLDARSKVTKALQASNAKIASIAPLKEYDWIKYASQLAEKKGLNIDQFAVRELAKRTLNDRDRLLNEIEKLSLYHNDITLNDVITLVSVPLEDKAFELSNALLRADISGALFTYNDLMKIKGTEPITLLMMLANQFRFLYIVNYLHDQGKSVVDIANELNANEYRVKIAYQNSKTIKKNLTKILDDMYQLDYQIKSGQIDHFDAIELFIINFKNNYC